MMKRKENEREKINVSLPKKPKQSIGKKTKVIIYFDLETTSFTGEICSIAATTRIGSKTKFTKFLIPNVSFDPEATEKNKMTLIDQQLYKSGQLVQEAVPIKDGLQEFSDWLSGFLETHEIVLVAHNAFRFDAKVLQRNFKEYGIPTLSFPTIFADSMNLFRLLQKRGLYTGKLGLSDLLIAFGIETDEESHHDAWNDTVNLILVCSKALEMLEFENFASYLRSENKNKLKQAEQFV